MKNGHIYILYSYWTLKVLVKRKRWKGEKGKNQVRPCLSLFYTFYTYISILYFYFWGNVKGKERKEKKNKSNGWMNLSSPSLFVLLFSFFFIYYGNSSGPSFLFLLVILFKREEEGLWGGKRAFTQLGLVGVSFLDNQASIYVWNDMMMRNDGTQTKPRLLLSRCIQLHSVFFFWISRQRERESQGKIWFRFLL